MKNKVVFILFLFILVFLFIFINNFLLQKDKYSIDAELNKCISQTSDTQVMNNCSRNALEKWSIEQNKLINDLEKLLDKKDYEQLQKTQYLWEQYKNSEMETIDKMLNNKDGSMYLNVKYGLQIELVKNRTLQLKEYLNVINE